MHQAHRHTVDIDLAQQIDLVVVVEMVAADQVVHMLAVLLDIVQSLLLLKIYQFISQFSYFFNFFPKIFFFHSLNVFYRQY